MTSSVVISSFCIIFVHITYFKILRYLFNPAPFEFKGFLRSQFICRWSTFTGTSASEIIYKSRKLPRRDSRLSRGTCRATGATGRDDPVVSHPEWMMNVLNLFFFVSHLMMNVFLHKHTKCNCSNYRWIVDIQEFQVPTHSDRSELSAKLYLSGVDY